MRMSLESFRKIGALAALLGLFVLGFVVQPAVAADARVRFQIESQDLQSALNQFALQSKKDVLFSPEITAAKRSVALKGEYLPEQALKLLLAGTGLSFRAADSKTILVVVARGEAKGSGVTDAAETSAEALRLAGVGSQADDGVEEMLVEGERDKDRPMAGGNLDLTRSENDPLPYQVFTRDEILRSGVVDLNVFIQQSLLESNATTLSSDQAFSGASNSPFIVSSNENLNLRGFGANQTIVLINGRRMPRSINGDTVGASDLNTIPISMIERVEVLPASASALYGDSAIGGVINVILRRDFRVSEISATYNNTTSDYDAPQSSVSLLHGGNFMRGKVQYRLNATFTRTVPATEADLGYMQREAERDRSITPPALTAAIFGATPNIRSANGSPLFGPGTSSVTSVAPGADGTGGLAAFAGRQGVRNFDFYDTPGSYTFRDSRSVDAPYGQVREQASYSGALTYSPSSWLELSLTGSLARNQREGGHAMFPYTINVPATSPFNPFNQAVVVTLLDTPVEWGEGFAQSMATTSTFALGGLFKLPNEWRLSADAQSARGKTHYQLLTTNTSGFNSVIASGLYNPFRDTQMYGPPDNYYRDAMLYFVSPGSTDPRAGIDFGVYSSQEYSLRLTNQSLSLPTGRGALVLGSNYYFVDLDGWDRIQRNLSGSLIAADSSSGPASVYQWGVYGELHAPLLPAHWLPRGIRAVEGDIAYRYAGSSTFKQSPNPPTVGLRVDFAGGLSLRSAYTSAYRPPTALQTQLTEDPIPTTPTITDPRRGNEQYQIEFVNAPNPDLLPEDANTLSLGLIWQGGQTHRWRAAVDYLYTDKTNEFTSFSTSTALTNELYYPERVLRDAPAPGDAYGVGRITFIRGGPINVLGRKSSTWSGSVRYTWNEALGGTLQASLSGFLFESFRTKLLPTTPMVENIENPDSSFGGLLKYRATGGLFWSKGGFGMGADGRYYHSQVLQRVTWTFEGSQRIARYMACDFFLQGDLSGLLRSMQSTPATEGMKLRGQFRVNNLFGNAFPVHRGSLGDVRPYGDWRGRVYLLSLTASF